MVFEENLAQGEVAEIRVALILLRDGWRVALRNNGATRDLEVEKQGMTEIVEVKNEDNYATSGNVCIELYQGQEASKPSGFGVTESTVCVHTLGDRAISYRTCPMRRLIRSGRLGQPRLFRGADNGNGGLIVAITDIEKEQWCEVVKIDNLGSSRIWGLTQVGVQ